MSFAYQNVLFLCQANSVRSQMAEGLFRANGPGGVNVYSAGFKPAGLDRRVIEVMKEIGVDVSGHESYGFDMIPKKEIDLLIDLRKHGGREDLPPGMQGVEYRQWPTSDPYLAPAGGEDGLDYFRAVRDELKGKIDTLLND